MDLLQNVFAAARSRPPCTQLYIDKVERKSQVAAGGRAHPGRKGCAWIMTDAGKGRATSNNGIERTYRCKHGLVHLLKRTQMAWMMPGSQPRQVKTTFRRTTLSQASRSMKTCSNKLIH